MNKYLNIWINNPIKTWWKARKYFKFPNIEFECYWNKKYHHNPYRGKIIDFLIFDVRWKDKYDSPRFEIEPRLYLCLFGILELIISLHVYYINELGNKTNADDYYWEYLLDYLYYNKKLSEVANWRGDSQIYKEYKNDKEIFSRNSVQITNFSLTKKGFKQLRKELYDNRNNRTNSIDNTILQ